MEEPEGSHSSALSSEDEDGDSEPEDRGSSSSSLGDSSDSIKTEFSSQPEGTELSAKVHRLPLCLFIAFLLPLPHTKWDLLERRHLVL